MKLMLPPHIQQPTPKQSIGYRIGQLAAIVMILCLAAIVIALTIRVCSWILTI